MRVLVIILLVLALYLIRRSRQGSNLIKTLCFGTDLLSRHGIPYWLYHGTLLGVVRDGDLIDGDNDVDCCIQKKYVSDLMRLKGECEKAGFKLERHRGPINYQHGIPLGEDFCRITHVATGSHLDIGLAVSTRGLLSDPCVNLPNTLRQTWYYSTIFPLRKVDIFGQTFTIPNDPDAVNFAQYNRDCYQVRKNSADSLEAENHHNTHTRVLLEYLRES